MRKLSLLALVAFVSGAAFAQDAPAVKRTFRVYMDAISGDVVTYKGTNTSEDGKTTYTDRRATFQGSEFEFGLVYGQNWAKVPWLTTTFVLKGGIKPGGIFEKDTTTGQANLSASAQTGADTLNWIRGQVGLDFTKYFSMYMDTRLLFGFTLQYSKSFGAHNIFVQAGAEILAGNKSAIDFKKQREAGLADIVRFENPVNAADATKSGAILDAFWIDLAWTAKMPMGFANTLLFRPVGFGGDSGAEIAEGFYVRLQETLSWSNAGFSIYARIRYNIRNIAFPTYKLADGSGSWTKAVRHDLSLRAGLSYAYDFSKL